jgi:hypothetical protein
MISTSHLLEEQETRIKALERQRAGDLSWAASSVDAGFCTSRRSTSASSSRTQALQAGRRHPPARQAAVERGHATSSDIEEALELQKGIPLVCRRCGERTMSGGMDVSSLDACPSCKGPLEPVSRERALRPPLLRPIRRRRPARLR